MEEKEKQPTPKSILTKQRIFQAAVDIMAEKGYGDTTIRAICKRANVAPPTFYLYYPSKTDIIWDILLPAETYWKQVFPTVTDGMTFLEKYNHFVIAYAVLIQNIGPEAAVFVCNPDQSNFGRQSEMRQVLRLVMAQGKEEGILSPDCDPAKAAHSLLLMIRGTILYWTTVADKMGLRPLLEHEAEQLLFGLYQRKEHECAMD